MTDTTLSEALNVLRKRKRILAVFVLLGLVVGIYKAVMQPRIYEAFGRIQVRSGSSNEYRMNAIAASMTGNDNQRMGTEVAILQSDTLMLTVAREMDLANNPDFLDGKAPQPRVSLNDPVVRQKVIHKLQATLHIAQVPKTEIIRISYQSLSPKLASDIVNKVIAAYIQRSYETRFSSSQRISNWLSGQLDDLKQQVQTSEEQMLDVQKRLGILGSDPTKSQINDSLEQLTAAYNEARIARIMAESRYRMLNGMDPNSIETPLDPNGSSLSELSTLRSQIATARAAYAQMESDLGPNHPQAKAQKAQIEELSKEINTEQQRLVLQAKQAFEAAKTNEAQTTATLETEKANAYKLRDDMVEYTIRQREFESNRELYEGLLQKLRTAGVEAGLESLEIDVVDAAMVPATPVLKPKSTVIAIYLFFATLAGIMLCFLLDNLDTGLRSVSEIEALLELPSLSVVPKFKQTPEMPGQSIAARNIISLSQPKSQPAEAFRALRTALLLSSAGHPPKFIQLTSATPAEGKSTASSNLATVLAQGGARVLLIDADLRRPTIHQRFGLPAKTGLSTVLAGAARLEDVVQHVPEIPNLDVLVSGPMPPFPTEMVGSETMTQLLKHAGEIYNHIIVDTPPVLSVTDGVLLGHQSDAVVLVVRHGKTSKHIVRRARDLMLRSGLPVAGVLLNAVDLSSPDYYGYYGYSNYSSAGSEGASWQSSSVKDSEEVKR